MNNYLDLYANVIDYQNPFPDMFGRARHYNSNTSNIFDPVISRSMYSNGFRPFYPENKKFAVCISHDIDHLFDRLSTQRKFVNLVKGISNGHLGWTTNNLRKLFREKINNEYDLRNLISINNKYKIKSSYYFLSLHREEEDYNYSLDKIDNQLKEVLRSGNEIGLHGSHLAFNNADKLSSEKKMLEGAIGREVKGYRNHYLRFEIPTTWRNLENTGFSYDTTLGYADCIGFKNGMCYPFYPYDAIKNEFLEVVELPLIIMDATLFYYMRLDSNVAFKICKELIDQVKKFQGVLTLLWHNNFLAGEMGVVYLRILDYLKKEDPWFATSHDLVDWWEKENLLKASREIIKELIKVN